MKIIFLDVDGEIMNTDELMRRLREDISNRYLELYQRGVI